MARALLLIDVQKIYTTPGSPLFVKGHEKAIANMNRLAKAFAAAGETIIYVRHQHKKDGSDFGRMFDYLGTPAEPGFVKGTPEVDFDPAIDNRFAGACTLSNSAIPAFRPQALRISCGTKPRRYDRRDGLHDQLLLRDNSASSPRHGLLRRLHHGCNGLSGPFRRCDARENQVCRGRFVAGRICTGADN